MSCTRRGSTDALPSRAWHATGCANAGGMGAERLQGCLQVGLAGCLPVLQRAVHYMAPDAAAVMRAPGAAELGGAHAPAGGRHLPLAGQLAEGALPTMRVKSCEGCGQGTSWPPRTDARAVSLQTRRMHALHTCLCASGCRMTPGIIGPVLRHVWTCALKLSLCFLLKPASHLSSVIPGLVRTQSRP